MRHALLFAFVGLLLIAGCAGEAPEGPQLPPGSEAPGGAMIQPGPKVPEGPESPAAEPPPGLPEGMLVDEVPADADVIFSSIRYVLSRPECLDENYELKENFINDAACNGLIYAYDGQLASPRQLFVMDLETGDVTQLTNIGCVFFSAQPIDRSTLMASAVCEDTTEDGMLNDKDQPELYMLDLAGGEMDCLTCGYDLMSINNPDYSHEQGKIVFSARDPRDLNHIYTIDAEKELVMVTNDSNYWDFDCAWFDDGSGIVFNRLPNQSFPWTIPSQVWVMGVDGGNQVQITEGGPDIFDEKIFGIYPIGIDADPDTGPDNSKVVFSRLKTGQENWPYGVYELRVVDLESRGVEVLDSKYANMLPEWKEGGIVMLRQIGTDEDLVDPMELKQSLYLYKDGEFTDLEGYPYNVFPLGAYSASWIEYG